jgi:hypothetical protein
VWVNAVHCHSPLPALVVSDAKRAQPLHATQLRGARANCEDRGAGGIRWNEVPLAFAAANRSSLERRLVCPACSAIQANDRRRCS